MKEKMQQGSRRMHLALARKPLPDKLAIYFHELERHQWPAFRDGLNYLKDQGYRPVTASEFIASQAHLADGTRNRAGRIDRNDRCDKGARAVPEAVDKEMFISFDDNYKSWHQALPLYDELSIKVMFYTNTLPMRDHAGRAEISAYFDRLAFNGERVPLSIAELRDIHSAGHEVGCHTHSHFALSELPRQQWDHEILASKEQLEDWCAEPVEHFSFPYGMRRFLPAGMINFCRSAGFQSIAYGIPGLQHGRGGSSFLINRTNWRLDKSLGHNIANLEVDGAFFERLTGRSAIG